jgi:CRISPR-associated protein Csm3
MKDKEKKLYGKVVIKGVLRAETGLHVGGAKESVEIGKLDAPVIRHPITYEPYIPGSSLKGKLRSLFELSKHAESKDTYKIVDKGSGERFQFIHVCDSWENARSCEVCRIFGASGKESNFNGRLRFRDLHLTARFSGENLVETEIKIENAICRVTSQANPRTIERVPSGTEFEFEVIYNVEDPNEISVDLKNLFSAFKLLEDDYLGGGGSRGHGKVKFFFSEIVLKPLAYYFKGEKPEWILQKVWDSSKTAEENQLEPLDRVYEMVKGVESKFVNTFKV